MSPPVQFGQIAFEVVAADLIYVVNVVSSLEGDEVFDVMGILDPGPGSQVSRGRADGSVTLKSLR